MLGAVADDPARHRADALRLRSGKDVGRRQTIGEKVYEVAQVQVAEQGLPTKAIGRWFPYVATLMLFIWVVNMLGFIPLPLTGEKWHGVPTWGIYAATSSLSVTLALALLTFVFTHVEGIRWNGAAPLLQELDPGGAEGAALPDRPARDPRPVHAADLAQRPALREHARGPHADPHVHRPDLHPASRSSWPSFVVPIATVFYLFEVVIVVSIQAFIFAALSAIYIGSAIEPEH